MPGQQYFRARPGGHSDFSERIGLLQQKIGYGKLKSEIIVNQIYAHYQHEDMTIKHTHGGVSQFLRLANFSRMRDNMETMADAVLRFGTGAGLRDTMIRVTLVTAGVAREQTPVLPAPGVENILRDSYRVIIDDDGAPVFSTLPAIGRLTQKQITERHKIAGYAARDD